MKDGRKFRITFHGVKESVKILQNYWENLKFDNLFAFVFYQKKLSLETTHQGWNIYHINKEILRQKIKITDAHILPHKSHSLILSNTENNSQKQENIIPHKEFFYIKSNSHEIKNNNGIYIDETDDQPLYRVIKNLNSKGNSPICSTYPKELIIPYLMTLEEIEKCASFRSKNRLPVLSYYYKIDEKRVSTLWRSAQCQV